MAQLFFLVKVLEKLSIAALRFFFQVLLEGKRTSQNGYLICFPLPKALPMGLAG
jgi:hypothetical protein